MSGDTINTLSALEKTVYGKAYNLIPTEQEKLTKYVNKAPVGKVGGRFEVMAVLSLDHSTTFHGEDDQSITLDDEVAGSQQKVFVTPSSMSFPMTLSKKAMDRLMGDSTSFEEAVNYRLERAQMSFLKVIETVHNHGGNGIGQFSSVVGSVITVSAASWATAIWVGAKDKPIDIYNTAGTKILSTSITAVDTVTRQLTLASVVGLSNGTTYDIYPRNAKGKESLGLFKILGTTSGNLFGLSTTDNDLWSANQKALGSKDLDWAAFASAVAEAAGRGIYGPGYKLLMNTIHFPKMVPNFNTAKKGAEVSNVASTFPANHAGMFQTPQAVTSFKFGTKSLSFQINDCEAEVETSEYVKRGEAAMINLDCIMRVIGGRGDIELMDIGPNGEKFRLLEGKMAYEARLYTDQALFTPELNRHLYFSGINADSLVS